VALGVIEPFLAHRNASEHKVALVDKVAVGPVTRVRLRRFEILAGVLTRFRKLSRVEG
jgi:hypothetical protein